MANVSNLVSHTCDGVHQYFSGHEYLKSADGFRIGDRVTWQAFTDHRGKHHEAIAGLRVRRITRIASRYGSHIRLTCDGPGYFKVEGNANNFTKEAAQ